MVAKGRAKCASRQGRQEARGEKQTTEGQLVVRRGPDENQKEETEIHIVCFFRGFLFVAGFAPLASRGSPLHRALSVPELTRQMRGGQTLMRADVP